ncbi:MAG: DUF2480 family protein [Flavobacteriales bacterium]|nr:DUF2480 family protein [Flavobacteriales bacterium]
MSEIINKVAASGLVTIDLEAWYPAGERREIDIAQQLWQGLALREKEFREWVKNNHWEQYRDSIVSVYCSVDAIIPHWAYMLIASSLVGISKKTLFGHPTSLDSTLFHEFISQLDVEEFRDKRLVIKGCSNLPVPVSAYVDLINKLQPIAKSIMFGEPCSTVPVFKR